MLPNITVAPDVKLVPRMETEVPPLVLPLVGDIDVTVGLGGTGAWYVNWSVELVAEVPPGDVTVISTVPACPGGDTA